MLREGFEAALVVAIVFAANFAVLPFVTPARGTGLALPGLAERVALFCVVFSVLAAYFVWCWSNGRRTLAMKTWKLRLVRGDGSVVTPKAALLRYLATWIGPALAVGAYAVLAMIAAFLSIPAGIALFLALYRIATGVTDDPALIAPWWWLAAVPIVLPLMAALATGIPARIATRIATAEAVRYE